MATFKRVLVSALAVLSWAASVANATSYKVDIVVHYELICPHSQEIVKDQAVPAWRQLRQIMNLMMIPYGNTVAQVVDNSTIPPVLNYSCQHGEPECFGNAVMVDFDTRTHSITFNLIFSEFSLNFFFIFF